ncbi:MAG: type II toxin-antitoxin system VapC family toxin [Coriobacteriia bacterium]|nr:type II toxin-antitoxin system VapC family toxin [Coriobacteriia bacterium]
MSSDMQVVDSCGWIDYLEGGSHRASFRPIIHDTEHLMVPAIIFYEVFKYFKRSYSDQDACQAAFAMKEARQIQIDHVLAFQAADLALEHDLAMGDALILATARAYYATLHTLDRHFEGIEGVELHRSKPQ